MRDFEDKKVMLEKGQTFILTGEEVFGNKERASITYENLWQDVTVGTKILIDDGLIGMQVDKIENKEIYCTVLMMERYQTTRESMYRAFIWQWII